MWPARSGRGVRRGEREVKHLKQRSVRFFSDRRNCARPSRKLSLSLAKKRPVRSQLRIYTGRNLFCCKRLSTANARKPVRTAKGPKRARTGKFCASPLACNLPCFFAEDRRQSFRRRETQKNPAPFVPGSSHPVVRDDRAGWWAVRDSNSRHPRCKRGALPTELTARRWKCLLGASVQLGKRQSKQPFLFINNLWATFCALPARPEVSGGFHALRK